MPDNPEWGDPPKLSFSRAESFSTPTEILENSVKERFENELTHDLLARFGNGVTEAVRRVRIGQRIYRQRLMDLWEGRCAISGLEVPEILRARHAKPWAQCESDAERLDVFNGLLLAAHLDAAFDVGLIAIDEDGVVLVSPQLDGSARSVLGLASETRISGLQADHHKYLAWHRRVSFAARIGSRSIASLGGNTSSEVVHGM